jgi:hypothetical protein
MGTRTEMAAISLRFSQFAIDVPSPAVLNSSARVTD